MTHSGSVSGRLAQGASLVAILWTGMLWTICGIVAPGLFAVLDDRRLAGDIAGEFFHIATWAGFGFGVLLALLLRAMRRLDAKRSLWIALAALPPVVNEAVVLPVMGAARAAGNMARFGMLHTVSATLFLAAGLAVLVLVLKLNRPAE